MVPLTSLKKSLGLQAREFQTMEAITTRAESLVTRPDSVMQPDTSPSSIVSLLGPFSSTSNKVKP